MRPRGVSGTLARVKKRWAAAGVVVLLAVITGGLAFAYPSAAATTCPGCYGLTRVQAGV